MQQDKESSKEETYTGVIVIVLGSIVAYFGHDLASYNGLNESLRLVTTVLSFLIGAGLGYVFRKQIKLLIALGFLSAFIYGLFWLFE